MDYRTYTYHHVVGLGVVVEAGDNCARETPNQVCILANVLSVEDLVLTVREDERHDVRKEGYRFESATEPFIYTLQGEHSRGFTAWYLRLALIELTMRLRRV